MGPQKEIDDAPAAWEMGKRLALKNVYAENLIAIEACR